jgi:hypothetical protein
VARRLDSLNAQAASKYFLTTSIRQRHTLAARGNKSGEPEPRKRPPRVRIVEMAETPAQLAYRRDLADKNLAAAGCGVGGKAQERGFSHTPHPHANSHTRSVASAP